jgi:hypothetical protein
MHAEYLRKFLKPVVFADLMIENFHTCRFRAYFRGNIAAEILPIID